MQQAPPPISVSAEDWDSGHGARRQRAMLGLNAAVVEDAESIMSDGAKAEGSAAAGEALPEVALRPELAGTTGT
jgi:hypothetical protein